MPKDEFDFDDPMELNGVGLACEEDTSEAMTECFVEEFMRLGYNHKQMLALFRNPHYIGMNMVLQNKGEPFVREKIAEVFARWGREVVWPAPTTRPLTPTLSPSEGERENGSQSPGESGVPRLIREPDAIPPLPQGEGRSEGDCLATQRAPDSPPSQTVELDESALDPTGTPIPKLHV
jgi:hypothetical protein